VILEDVTEEEDEDEEEEEEEEEDIDEPVEVVRREREGQTTSHNASTQKSKRQHMSRIRVMRLE
jgi:hypothetical protein